MNAEKTNAKIALEFLKRSEVKGSEVPAFVEVSNWLNSIIDAPDFPEPPASKPDGVPEF